MTKQKHIIAGNLNVGNDLPFTLIAGPCQMESENHAMMMAGRLKEIADKLNIGLIYKSSFDKANRSSISGKRGIGLEKALPIFEKVNKEYNIPVLTDVHEKEQCEEVASVVDVLQIPAFLCRQTDLLIAAAKTGRVVNVKKGQFLAPWDMKNVVQKLIDSGNDKIMLTERGVSFGYNTLVVDMRSLPIMAENGYPIVFDATHAVQQPGGLGNASGGQRHFVPTLAKSAVAAGVAAVFMETHQDPDNAPSDGPCMVILDELEAMLTTMIEIDKAVKK